MAENNQTKSNGRGGKREGAGRPAGSANKRTREIADAIANDGDLTPLEYLMDVMRNVNEEPKTRLSAAVAAAPYVHPKLSSVDVSAEVNGTLVHGILKVPPKNV